MRGGWCSGADNGNVDYPTPLSHYSIFVVRTLPTLLSHPPEYSHWYDIHLHDIFLFYPHVWLWWKGPNNGNVEYPPPPSQYFIFVVNTFPTRLYHPPENPHGVISISIISASLTSCDTMVEGTETQRWRSFTTLYLFLFCCQYFQHVYIILLHHLTFYIDLYTISLF